MKLSVEIITGNYQHSIYSIVYFVAEKCGNYMDTGVSKNVIDIHVILSKTA